MVNNKTPSTSDSKSVEDEIKKGSTKHQALNKVSKNKKDKPKSDYYN